MHYIQKSYYIKLLSYDEILFFIPPLYTYILYLACKTSKQRLKKSILTSLLIDSNQSKINIYSISNKCICSICIIFVGTSIQRYKFCKKNRLLYKLKRRILSNSLQLIEIIFQERENDVVHPFQTHCLYASFRSHTFHIIYLFH